MGGSPGRRTCRRSAARWRVGGTLLLRSRLILLSLLFAPLLCSCAGRLLRSGLWPSARWGRGRLLHATLPVVQSEERNVSWDRRPSPFMPLSAARRSPANWRWVARSPRLPVAPHHCGDRRWHRACGPHGQRPRQGSALFLDRAESAAAHELAEALKLDRV